VDYIFSIDQGTSSTRTLVLDSHCKVVSVHQEDFELQYPDDGWVEQRPEEIWQSVLNTLTPASERYHADAIAITNQRETTLLWHRDTGEVLGPAIVWQDRRTTDYCESLKERDLDKMIAEKTGLMIDPYFSATKLKWLLDNVKGARQLANDGQLMFGTIDSFLLYRLTGRQVHATDATNASRTMLFNIHTQQWDPELLELFNIPESLLPEVRDSASDFGCVSEEIIRHQPIIKAVIGDQQAALVGQRCFSIGDSKSTYGTGSFLMVNTGSQPQTPTPGLLTTIGYRLNGKSRYAVEGSIFIAGAAIQWLRDALGVIDDAGESQTLAQRAKPDHHVIMVPAFTGLGAPHWKPTARASILGLTRDTGKNEICAAALEASGFQTLDLIDAIRNQGTHTGHLTIDGGMTANDWFCQSMADILGHDVYRSKEIECTAIGAALLALYGDDIETRAPELAREKFSTTLDTHPRQAAWASAIKNYDNI